MRQIAASLMFGVVLIGTVSAEPLKPTDRQRLLTHLEMTESWLASEVEGLSPAQLAFQMTPDSWSIAQVVEHLAIAEPQYWSQVQASLQEPAAPPKGDVTDAQILWYGIDRTQRDKTGAARVPTGKFKDAAAALAEFQKLRADIRAFANATQDDLRGRPLKGGNMQLYQWVLMISTHAQRHILQIREIKASDKYPKDAKK
jgi:DinB superfamily